MFGLSGIGIGLKMLAAGVLLTAVAGAYWHYTSVKNERNAALARVGALNVAHAVQEDTISTLEGAIDQWQAQATQFQAALNAMTEAQVEASSQTRRLNNVLSKHDLERLSLAKPGLIERRINRGTADILSVFECASGRDCPDNDS